MQTHFILTTLATILTLTNAAATGKYMKVPGCFCSEIFKLECIDGMRPAGLDDMCNRRNSSPKLLGQPDN
ncbi:hypothetical protein CDD80_4576 [Ophiocordyceps camponoti-rufipedis]|uniref:Extracellular membrane protein CFEM domain-containing protein n=1 Tax=Ophiocordyceps camponoti-rufipedis TaxID=2004952 RepID=A0A2C5YX85_9HYPO|nr:hypothetical protein CDD80_4576 [Ophiocordyceps camponoti-rufipedis]